MKNPVCVMFLEFLIWGDFRVELDGIEPTTS